MTRLTQKSGLTRKREWCVAILVASYLAVILTLIIWGLAEGCAALNRWDPSVGLGWWLAGIIAALLAWGCVKVWRWETKVMKEANHD